MKTLKNQSNVVSKSAKALSLSLLALLTSLNTAYSQTNTLPQNGNVGIGTISPTSRLQVNGNAMIDSTLTVNDSLIIQKGARIKDVLRVDSDVIVKGDIRVKNDLKVNGKTTLKGNVVIKEGDLKLKSIADTTLSGNGILMINSNGKVVNGGSAIDIFYDLPILPGHLDCKSWPNALLPQWERSSEQMFLLNHDCITDVKLGVGIKPNANFHVLTSGNSTLPILVEKTAGSNQPPYKLLQLDNDGLLYAREVKVNLTTWPDYVFEKDYELQPLREVERYIQEHKHLPNIPSAKEIEEEGLSLGEMNRLLLQKVEELTLHLIEQQKRIEELERKIK